MKRIAVSAVLTMLVSLSLVAEPVKALLVVQSHVKDTSPVLASVGDQFASALGDELFEVINPHDVIGENQNVGPWGEKMPVSSAVRLAETCGADILITAAISDLSTKRIGSPALAGCLVVTWSVAAKKVPGGGTVCSVTVPCEGPKHAAAMLSANAQQAFDEALRGSIKTAASAFLAKAAEKSFAPRKVETVSVAFVANVAGADVKIDGVSRGIASTDVYRPLAVEVSKGLHNIEIAYPFMLPYSTTALLDGPSTFAVNLQESPGGRTMRMEDKAFDAAVERLVRGGAVDDDAKLVKAKGYAKCLEMSSFNIEGMPERLTMVKGESGSFGLGIIQEESK